MRSVRSAVTPPTTLILPSAEPVASSTTAGFRRSFRLSTMPRNALGSTSPMPAARTLMPLTSTAALEARSLPALAASLLRDCSRSFSSALTWSCTCAMRAGRSAGVERSMPATCVSRAFWFCTQTRALSPVMASMRRTPAATPPSETILNRPISPVRPTCVPPQSSREKPMSSTRTVSPYFSPNSAMAPPLTASS
ncbi:hypothetical protein D9M68_677750 [compost metagenome]